MAFYDKIPKVQCKGLCHESCTIAPAAKIEVKRVREACGSSPFNYHGVFGKIGKGDGDVDIPSCKALKGGRCSIYRFRPTICRLYGAAEGLECEFGCVPERYLSRTEARAILVGVQEL